MSAESIAAAAVSGAETGLVIDGATGKPEPPVPHIDLAKAIDVRREMCKVYREMKSRKIDPADGTKLVYALTAIGKLIELEEIEKRLDALEGRTNGKSLPSHR